MDLKDIKYIVHIAEVGNITTAASDFGIVQPVLSRHIKRVCRYQRNLCL
jgi:DNA-binding transcriptional LysR family regulator